MITLNLTGEIPAELDLAPAQAVIGALNQTITPDGNVNLRLVNDAEMAELNQQHAGHAYPTDVLSFSYIEQGEAPIAGDLGDMVISLQTAARQAQAAHTTLAVEMALLALHGCLHILGYDHADPAQRQQLEHMQARLMAAAQLPYRDFAWQE